MTDARFPERWVADRRILRLSDPSFRVFTLGLLWSVANRTDGRIDRDDLFLIPGRAGTDEAAELCAAGVWEPTAEGWQIVDFAATQTSRDELEVLENARRREREKKARQRARPSDVPGDSPEGRPGGSVPGTTQEGRKAGRQAGQAPKNEHAGTPGNDATAAERWSVVGAMYDREAG